MNGYETSFVKWFRKHGWQIRGTDVWSDDGDTPCPFKLTDPMVARLEREGVLQKIWPESAPCWQDCYQLNEP